MDLPDCQAPRHCIRSTSRSPHRHTWASIVTPQAAADPNKFVAADWGLLEPLFTKMEMLHSEMQTLTVSRLEVVQPLHDMMTALQGWMTRLGGFMEQMEVVVGQLGCLPASLQSLEMPAVGSVGNVAGGVDVDSEVASCSSELLASVVQLGGVTPVLVSFSPLEEHAEAVAAVACAEAALGSLPVEPPMSQLPEHQVGFMDGREACLYGCFSPRAPLCTSPLPVMLSDPESEVVTNDVAPVIQSMPELHVLSVETISPSSMVLSKVDSLGAMTVASTPSPPPLEPACVESGGPGTSGRCSLEPFGGVVPMADEIVVAGVLVPNPGVLLATKICEFLANLDSENSGKRLDASWRKKLRGRSTRRVALTLDPTPSKGNLAGAKARMTLQGRRK